MVDKSTAQIAKSNDRATVTLLIKGYEARLETASPEMKPAVEIILNSARERLTLLDGSTRAPATTPSDAQSQPAAAAPAASTK